MIRTIKQGERIAEKNAAEARFRRNSCEPQTLQPIYLTDSYAPSDCGGESVTVTNAPKSEQESEYCRQYRFRDFAASRGKIAVHREDSPAG